MGLRPGRCYSSLEQRPYTRVAIKVHEKNYVGAIPPLRIRQFNMGNPRRKYTHIADLVVEKGVQIRDNALEAARICINRFLNNKVGKDNYFMRIRVFPHQVLREHKQAQGAGADRVSQGMSHAFGKPIGRAVRVRKGQVVISVLAMQEHMAIVKKALLRAKDKFPCPISVKIHTDVESIGTRPSHIIEEITELEEKKKEEEEKAEAGKETEGKESKEAKKEQDEGKKEDRSKENKDKKK
ncbi:MAG: 50S ribosomal protein L16 [Candidatus Diapherotrites archaeon]|nr:50S ribosomal protein L16 [Candidatus Diapherotrites archaeon]